jgi:hypothetical protein
MRYPKKGEVVMAQGQMMMATRSGPFWRGEYVDVNYGPAIVLDGGFDPNGKVRIRVPLVGDFWAAPYNFLYPDTNLCGDGISPWKGWLRRIDPDAKEIPF